MAAKSNRKPDLHQAAQAAGLFTIMLAAIVALYATYSGAFMVAAHEQAVVLRFGAVQRTVGPGLHFKMPWAEERMIVDMSDHTLRLPWGEGEQGGLLAIERGDEEAALILTGDLYAAVVEWNIMWRVSDPQRYLFSVDHDDIEALIISVARSTMNRAVGDYAADELLTAKRSEVGLAALTDMQRLLAEYECGVEIFDLQMQRIIPPLRVKPSFDEVNASIQQRDRLINEARREENQLLPVAEARSDQLIREAEGYASRRLAESEGEISALLAKWEQYKRAPELTRQRMYLETMERVLSTSGQKTILDHELQGLLPLLNLNEATK